MTIDEILSKGIDYKSKTKLSGIYIIYCLANKMIYIGSSNNYWARKKNHKFKLKSGKHKNPQLQNSYNKYGKESFLHLFIEEVVNTEFLIERENYYLSNIDRNQLFNFVIPAIKGFPKSKITEETRKKISLASKKRWTDQKYREKMKLAMKNVFTEEMKNKISTKSKKTLENPINREKALNNIKWTEERRMKVKARLNTPEGKIIMSLRGKKAHIT